METEAAAMALHIKARTEASSSTTHTRDSNMEQSETKAITERIYVQSTMMELLRFAKISTIQQRQPRTDRPRK